jgi:hypothetical protein
MKDKAESLVPSETERLLGGSSMLLGGYACVLGALRLVPFLAGLEAVLDTGSGPRPGYDVLWGLGCAVGPVGLVGVVGGGLLLQHRRVGRMLVGFFVCALLAAIAAFGLIRLGSEDWASDGGIGWGMVDMVLLRRVASQRTLTQAGRRGYELGQVLGMVCWVAYPICMLVALAKLGRRCGARR